MNEWKNDIVRSLNYIKPHFELNFKKKFYSIYYLIFLILKKKISQHKQSLKPHDTDFAFHKAHTSGIINRKTYLQKTGRHYRK